MHIAKLGNKIQQQSRNGEPNDIIYTPLRLVDRHSEYIKDLVKDKDIIYEPFSGDGRYVNCLREKYPNNEIKETEIQNGTDFFLFNEPIDIIISNPPYSKVSKILEHSVNLKPRIISYLIGYLNLTPKRMTYMNENGYFIDRILFCKVRGFFGMTAIVTFRNDISKNIVDIERFEYNKKYD